jgi:hypothetical protein
MTTERKKDVIIVALSIALVALVIKEIKYPCPVCPPCSDVCIEKDRYSTAEKDGGGREIDLATATSLVNEYRRARAGDPAPYSTTGFMLSKKVFDNIFSECSLNSVFMDLVVESGGKLAIVLRGAKTENTAVTTGASSGIYINQSMCPIDCLAY